jgi:branched-chain amino acid transport system substrate-binding protein
MAAPTVVKIGVLAPLSGSVASQGALMKEGCDACLKYFNQEVGFKNLKNVEVQLVYADSESDPNAGQAAFEKLVNSDNVIAVLGSYQSSVTVPCATLANKYKVPYVIINSISDADLAQNANYVFRPCVGTFSQEAPQAAWLKQLGAVSPIKNIAFVGSDDEYGQGEETSLKRIAQTDNLGMSVDELVPNDASDLSAVVQKIKSSNADIIVASLQLNDALLMMKQLKEYDCNVPMYGLGGGFADANFISSAGDDGKYVVTSAAWLPDMLNNLSSTAQTWAATMKKDGGAEPTETAVNSWLALGITLYQMDKYSATDRQSLADAIDKTDMGPSDWPNMFNQHPYIKFQDEKLPDGKMMYNQNLGAGLVFGQNLDGTYKLVGPFSLAGDYGSATNPMVWPPPAWKDR